MAPFNSSSSIYSRLLPAASVGSAYQITTNTNANNTTNASFNSSNLNTYNKQPSSGGLTVNNFPITGGMYSQGSGFDSLSSVWNSSRTNYYDLPPPQPNPAQVVALKQGSQISNGIAPVSSLASLSSSSTKASMQQQQSSSSSSLVTTLKDGYKLLVSNLHPKVTEDDVLVIIYSIGLFIYLTINNTHTYHKSFTKACR